MTASARPRFTMMLRLEALDEAACDLTFLVLVLVVDLVALGILHFLDDDLLGRLGRSMRPKLAASTFMPRLSPGSASSSSSLLACSRDDLCFGVDHLLDNRLELEDLQFARLFVVLGLELHLRPQLFSRRGEDGRLPGPR